MKEEAVIEGQAPYGMEFQFYCADDWETVTWEEHSKVRSWKADSSMN